MELTKNQQEIFDLVEHSTTNIFVTGKPGVGKSVLIHALTELGKKHYVLAAPTGLAAINIGGKTLHSIFRLPASDGIIHPTFNNFTTDHDTIAYIKYKVNHLIIDEVSMVRADMFDFIDRLMRYAKEKDEPFGGAQIIIVGDFYQLPPVANAADTIQLKQAGYDSPFVFSSKAFETFQMEELSEVLRQKGDPKFIKLLHSARTGDVTEKQLVELNKLVCKPTDVRIKLTSTNKIAELVNQTELDKIQSQAYTSNAGGGKGFEFFTSPGQTASDNLCKVFVEEYRSMFPEFKFRIDVVDGDDDKEANFTMIVAPQCPAILFENLFFDNRIEAEFLLSEIGQERIAQAMFNSILKIENALDENTNGGGARAG